MISVVIGIVLILTAIYELTHIGKGAEAGASFHRKAGQRAPWLYWVPGSRKVSSSEGVWRVMTPIGRVLVLIVGIQFVIVGLR
jgi:hypothetical protein